MPLLVKFIVSVSKTIRTSLFFVYFISAFSLKLNCQIRFIISLCYVLSFVSVINFYVLFWYIEFIVIIFCFFFTPCLFSNLTCRHVQTVTLPALFYEETVYFLPSKKTTTLPLYCSYYKR